MRVIVIRNLFILFFIKLVFIQIGLNLIAFSVGAQCALREGSDIIAPYR